MRKVTVTIVVGIALIAAVVVVTLTRTSPRVLRVGLPGGLATNRTVLDLVTGETAVCQTNEVLPAGASDIRISLWAFFGPQVHVIAYRGSQILTQGRRSADWTSDSVTVPIKPLNQATSHVRLCVVAKPNSEAMFILGAPSPTRKAALISNSGTPTPEGGVGEEQPLKGRMGVEYLAAGRSSWWSRVLSVARHMGLGRAFTGTWITALVAALMTAAIALTLRLTLRELP
jgi:hypothetical protein